jgi:DNA-binding NtrC family response regulator
MPAVSSPSPVLIIGSAAETLRHVTTVLEFLELHPLAVDREADLLQYLDARPGPYMILLDDCGDLRLMGEVFRRIKAADPYTPVVLLSREGVKLPPELDADALARLRLPLRQTECDAALQKVHTYRENRHQEGSPRSLELFRNLVGSSAGIQRVRNGRAL